MSVYLKIVMRSALVFSATLASLGVLSQPAQKLPPKAKKTENTLGQSQAMDEVRRMTESPSANTSSSAPSIVVTGEAVNSLSTAVPVATPTSARSVKVVPARPVAPKPVPVEEFVVQRSVPRPAPVRAAKVAPNPRQTATVWLNLDKGPEMGLLSGWTFTRKELRQIVGDGFTYGFFILQEIQPQIAAQFRLSGGRHSQINSDGESSLNVFPFEVSAQFAKDAGDFRLYIQPGLGGVLWKSRSERLIDQRLGKAKGFDFMASGGIGFKFISQTSPWRLGADLNMAYVSGYFDNYLSRLLVYTSYQF